MKSLSKIVGYALLALLLSTMIAGGIRNANRMSDKKAMQAAATRQDFIKDCTTDAPESYCACIYDGLGEELMLEAYDYYEKYGEYNFNFRNQAADCGGHLKEEL